MKKLLVTKLERRWLLLGKKSIEVVKSNERPLHQILVQNGGIMDKLTQEV